MFAVCGGGKKTSPRSPIGRPPRTYTLLVCVKINENREVGGRPRLVAGQQKNRKGKTKIEAEGDVPAIRRRKKQGD